jgi:putative FmdB family regulatory protein
MPIHEYVCTECGHPFEELVRTADQQVACPKCGSTKLDRKLSSFAAVMSAAASCRQGDQCPTRSCCAGGACHHKH